MGDDAGDNGQHRFDELGEVDVATLMATLSHEIEFGSAGVPLPSQGTSSAVQEQQLEKEFFDVEGILVYFGEVFVVDLF